MNWRMIETHRIAQTVEYVYAKARSTKKFGHGGTTMIRTPRQSWATLSIRA